MRSRLPKVTVHKVRWTTSCSASLEARRKRRLSLREEASFEEHSNWNVLEEKTKIVHHSKGVIFSRLSSGYTCLESQRRQGQKPDAIWKKDYEEALEWFRDHLLVPEQKVRDFVKRKRYGSLNNRKDWEVCIVRNF